MTTTSPPARSTTPSSPRSAGAITWAARCRSSPTSPTRSSGASARPPKGWTSPSSRSGGTVGDIESLPFLEAIRQFRAEVGSRNVIFMHLTLVPYIRTAGEVKTKPTQHSVIELAPHRHPARHPRLPHRAGAVERTSRRKIALFCNVDTDAVITAKDVNNIYEVPLNFHEEGLDEKVVELLNIWTGRPKLDAWQSIVETCRYPAGHGAHRHRGQIRGIEGELQEPLRGLGPRSHRQPLQGGAGLCGLARNTARTPRTQIFDAVHDGILVPGGFGTRGHGGEDQRHRPCAHRPDAVLRHLPGHAAGGGRIRPQRLRDEGGQLLRVRRGHSLSGHRSHGGSDRRREQGGDDAPGGLPLPASWRARKPSRRTARRRSASATVTATRSTTGSATRSRRRGSCCRGSPPTASSSRWWNSPTTPGSWDASSTPSSSRARWIPHPLFREFIRAGLEYKRAKGG